MNAILKPQHSPSNADWHQRRLAVTPLRFKRWLDESFIRFSIMRVFFLAESTATDNEVGAFYMRF